jgi:membrane-associated phospholipid phosphatase
VGDRRLTPTLAVMASAPLLTRQRAVAGVIALAALGTTVLGLHYAGGHSPGPLDTAIDSHLQHRLRGQLRFLHHLVTLADPVSVIVLCAALAAIFLLSGRRRAAVLAVLGPLVAAGFTEFVLKPLVGRRLLDNLSFPSGHTTAAVSVAVVVVVALLGPSRPSWPAIVRWTASALALLVAAAVATALVGSGYHYATDTVGGFCVAVGVVLSVAWAVDAVRKVGP